MRRKHESPFRYYSVWVFGAVLCGFLAIVVTKEFTSSLLVAGITGAIGVVVPALIQRSLDKNVPHPRAERIEVLDQLLERVKQTRECQFDVTVVSAHNVDHIFRVPDIGVDEEYQADEAIIEAGGSGANTAFALQKLGLRVSITGAVGNDAEGNLIRAAFTHPRTHVENLVVLPGKSGMTSVMCNRTGGRTIAVSPGVNDELGSHIASDARLEHSLASAIAASRIVHLSSFANHGKMKKVASIILENITRATLLGFTPGNIQAEFGLDDEYNKAILARANLLFIYESHLQLMLSKTALGPDPRGITVRDLAESVFRWKWDKAFDQPLLVCIKHTSFKSSESRERDYISIATGVQTTDKFISTHDINLFPHPNSIYDATGAGDACAAGIIFTLLKSRPLDEVCRAGFKMAMAASSSLGARKGLPCEI